MSTRRQFVSNTLALAIAQAFAIGAQADPLLSMTLIFDVAGRLLVPVYLNGHGPFRFLLDTGASRSCVSLMLAKQLGLAAKPTGDISINGTTGVSNASSMTIDQLELGTLRLERTVLTAIADEFLAGATGVIGANVLAGQCIDIDFKARSLKIGDAVTDSKLTTIHAQRKFDGLLLIDARVKGIACKAVFDTGAQRTFGNSVLAALLNIGKMPRTMGDSVVINATGRTIVGRRVSDLPLQLNELFLPRSISFADAEVFATLQLNKQPALVLGMDVIGTLSRLVIDYHTSALMLSG